MADSRKKQVFPKREIGPKKKIEVQVPKRIEKPQDMVFPGNITPEDLVLEQPLPVENRTPSQGVLTPSEDSNTPESDSRTPEIRTPELHNSDSRTPEIRTPELKVPDYLALDEGLTERRALVHYDERTWESRATTHRLQTRISLWRYERLTELQFILKVNTEREIVEEAIDLLLDKYYGADIRTPENSDSRTPDSSDSRKFGLPHINDSGLNNQGLINNALNLYSKLTGNSISQNDVQAFAHVSMCTEVDVELGIRQAVAGAKKARSRINGFGYCAKTILNVARENDPNKGKRLMRLRYEQEIEQRR